MPKAGIIRKLKTQQSSSLDELLDMIQEARENIAGKITAAAKGNAATSYSRREKLYKGICDYYNRLGNDIDDWGREMTKKTAKNWFSEAVTDIHKAEPDSIIKFDPERVKTYWQMIHPDNEQNLAAVFTDKMAAEDVRSLRQGFVEIFRRSSIEGMTHREINKALQNRWNDLAGDIAADRFVDSAGRKWDNARYFQMLVRTTTARVARESYIDTLVANEDDLMRIVNVGETCDLCEAWDDLIISITGTNKDYPSYQDALDAGWGHPNCDCMMERVDETLDKEDIERQAEAKNPKDWDDVEQVKEYKADFEGEIIIIDKDVVVQIETPEFKEWFEGSKITSEGKPLLVYRGDRNPVKFDENRLTWWTEDKEYANTYAGQGEQRFAGRVLKESDQPVVTEAFLKIEKPLDLIKMGDIEKERPISEILSEIGIKPKDYFKISRDATDRLNKIGERPSDIDIAKPLKDVGLTEQKIVVAGDFFTGGHDTSQTVIAGSDNIPIYFQGTGVPEGWRRPTAEEMRAYREAENIKLKRNHFDSATETIRSVEEHSEEMAVPYEFLRGDFIKEWLKKTGYDGLITQEQGRRAIAVFSREQFKIVKTSP